MPLWVFKGETHHLSYRGGTLGSLGSISGVANGGDRME